uniref:Granulins-like n=1 Tax=Sinocyclocheilus grahami TaxID=75366 RepID=A0A672LPN8_SINGR
YTFNIKLCVLSVHSVSDVPCNDTAACPDGTTCCKTKEGGWACCPLNNTILFVLKLVCSFLVFSVHSNVSCDDTASCPDGNTCCKTQEGGWACCPLPEAVCCDDFIHCCSHGTTCNVAAGSCDESSGSKSPGNVNCDSSHVCPDSNTCCENTDGDWSCCPLPEVQLPISVQLEPFSHFFSGCMLHRW